jgi:hypothetical protein
MRSPTTVHVQDIDRGQSPTAEQRKKRDLKSR